MKVEKSKTFKNGVVYALRLDSGHLIEVTDTFLPYYTKHAVVSRNNHLLSSDLGSRKERWMIGVSTMSGCPVGCKFCATAKLKKIKYLTAEEIVEQVEFVINNNRLEPGEAREFKINYTRMGEPFLNIENVRKAIEIIDSRWGNAHHYISTIGLKGADYSWIKDNVTLQLSIHSLDEGRRNWLIPFKHKASLADLGKIRTGSKLQTTINLTLVSLEDFDIVKIQKHFNTRDFFVKISPINENEVSKSNQVGVGVIEGVNLT